MAGILENGVVVTRFVTPMSILSNRPVFVMDTLSLRRQTVSQGVQRWELKTNVEPSNNSADLLVHSVVNGHDTVVDIQMPQVYRPRNGTTSSSAILTSAVVHNKGSLFVNIVNNNGVVLKGEFIQFANHDKVYMVTESRAGNGSLSIFPALLQNVPVSTGLFYGDDVVLKARYDTDSIQGITYTDGVLSDQGSITFIEAI